MSIFSRLAYAWAVRSFGPAHVIDTPTRVLRIVEEAIELCQAVGVPQDKVDLCTHTVYRRPPGDPIQEVGGILLTTNILCAAIEAEPDDILEKELARVLSKPPEHFAKRNQEKIDAGLDVPGTQIHYTAKDVFEYDQSTNKYYRIGPNGEKYELPPDFKKD